MRHSHLAFLSGLILFVILAMSWCGRKPAPGPTIPGASPVPITTATPAPSAVATVTVTPTPAMLAPTPTATAAATASPTPIPGPSQTPSAELQRAVTKAGSAIVSISVFDATGKLLHTGTGFYISSDGRFLTNWHVIDGGAHAVAKSADGKIRNVLGVLASAPAADLAIAKAETKIGVTFLAVNKPSEPKGAVAVVGSTLDHRNQPLATISVSAGQADQNGPTLTSSASLTADAAGGPLIDENERVVGMATLNKDQAGNSTVALRPTRSFESLFAQVTSETTPKWVGAPAETPSPSPTPRKLRIVSNPMPTYPEQARRMNPPMSGWGRFRIFFDANGQARQVQVMRSTGQPILDQAAVAAFQQWKSEPGHEWNLVIPITFRP